MMPLDELCIYFSGRISTTTKINQKEQEFVQGLINTIIMFPCLYAVAGSLQ